VCGQSPRRGCAQELEPSHCVNYNHSHLAHAYAFKVMPTMRYFVQICTTHTGAIDQDWKIWTTDPSPVHRALSGYIHQLQTVLLLLTSNNDFQSKLLVVIKINQKL